MIPFLSAQDQINESELHAGLRNLMFDGICTQILGVLAGGAFLIACALQPGAPNLVIGLLAALVGHATVHGYPYLIHRLCYRRTNHRKLYVRGYKVEGTTTTLTNTL